MNKSYATSIRVWTRAVPAYSQRHTPLAPSPRSSRPPDPLSQYRTSRSALVGESTTCSISVQHATHHTVRQ
eukprot:1743070-Rhodomonas_salina.2